MKIRFLLFILPVFIMKNGVCQTSSSLNGQAKPGWFELMKDPSVNFYEVQKAFNKTLKKYERRMKHKMTGERAGELEEKMPGYMQYKRWEWFTEPRMDASGDRTVISKAREEVWKSMSNAKKNPTVMQAGNWTLLGPTTSIPTNGGGAGRVNCMAIYPGHPDTLFIGSPAGGLWKTMDGGLTWSTGTDNLANLGISDIAINPIHPDTMYVATGDGDGDDNYTIGILKSTDGGNTWNITGFSNIPSQTRQVNRLLIDPVNPNILFAGATQGIYRSTDAGDHWVRVSNATGISDLEFRPGNSKVIYASGSSYYRSMDGGNTFSTVPTGPGAGASRVAIAVTPADTNYVYAIAGNSGDQGLLAVYRSTDGGYTFVQKATSPNLLGWSSNGTDFGGQAWYDLSIAASPTNKDEIYTGGVNIWRSTNGGTNWAIKAHWTATGAPYVHADVHTLVYPAANTIYAGCDGGFFRTTNNGTSWSNLSDGLQIAEMYRLGCSVTNPTLVLQGWQDNGTNRWSAGAWKQVYGGDGMECFIDRTNANVWYVETYNGNFQRTLNAGSSWTNVINGFTETGAWVTPWCQDPNTPQTLYAGLTNVWKSTNQGSSWSKISTTFTSQLQSLAVAPSNPAYIYAASSGSIYRTTNGGTNWTSIKSGLPGGSMTYIAVSGSNPDRVWVTYSGYTAANKVFRTANGGAAWVNITYDLPNLPVNCVVVDTASALEGVYVGTDVGVYYIDSTRTNWTFFSNGLPNVIVNELEIQYSSGKLRAATYGRGLWETSLHDPNSAKPLANFKGDILKGCPGHVVQFTDMSTGNPTAWSWSFPDGTPSSSTQQNPVVAYTVPGTYSNVSLTVTNATGNDSVIKYSYISTSPGVKPITKPAGSVTVCAASIQVEPSAGSGYKWLPGGQVTTQLNVNSSGTYQVIVSDVFGCADTSAPVTITLQSALPQPAITANGDTLTCNPSAGYNFQWYLNGSPVPGATQYTVTGTPGGSYYVVISNSIGCSKQSNSLLSGVEETDLPGITMLITPSPNNGNFALEGMVEGSRKISLEILDITGRVIHQKDLGIIVGKIREDLSLPLPSGIYFIALNTEEGKAVKKFVVK